MGVFSLGASGLYGTEEKRRRGAHPHSAGCRVQSKGTAMSGRLAEDNICLISSALQAIRQTVFRHRNEMSSWRKTKL
jgi:hypothetical protein